MPTTQRIWQTERQEKRGEGEEKEEAEPLSLVPRMPTDLSMDDLFLRFGNQRQYFPEGHCTKVKDRPHEWVCKFDADLSDPLPQAEECLAVDGDPCDEKIQRLNEEADRLRALILQKELVFSIYQTYLWPHLTNHAVSFFSHMKCHSDVRDPTERFLAMVRTYRTFCEGRSPFLESSPLLNGGELDVGKIERLMFYCGVGSAGVRAREDEEELAPYVEALKKFKWNKWTENMPEEAQAGWEIYRDKMIQMGSLSDVRACVSSLQESFPGSMEIVEKPQPELSAVPKELKLGWSYWHIKEWSEKGFTAAGIDVPPLLEWKGHRNPIWHNAPCQAAFSRSMAAYMIVERVYGGDWKVFADKYGSGKKDSGVSYKRFQAYLQSDEGKRDRADALIKGTDLCRKQ